ncbi:MAG: hypothetical protein RLZZ69_304, partial [Cyanobacteriota bacterium]
RQAEAVAKRLLGDGASVEKRGLGDIHKLAKKWLKANSRVSNGTVFCFVTSEVMLIILRILKILFIFVLAS